MESADKLAMVGLIGVAGAETFRAFMPAIQDVRLSDPTDPAMRQVIRTGEAMSVATVATLSIAVAAFTNHPGALVLGLVLCAVMVAGYETAASQAATTTGGTPQ